MQAEIEVRKQAQAGYLPHSRVDQLVEEAVALAVAHAREEERQTAQSMREREITTLMIASEVDAIASRAAAERALEDAQAVAVAELAETVDREREQAMQRQVQAVESAVAATVANERARANMTGIVSTHHSESPNIACVAPTAVPPTHRTLRTSDGARFCTRRLFLRAPS